MKQALDALEDIFGKEKIDVGAINALRQAIEQAEQAQPFGYFRYDMRLDAWVQNRAGITGTPFYTAPPPRKPLTEEEIEQCCYEADSQANDHPQTFKWTVAFARAIEASHGIIRIHPPHRIGEAAFIQRLLNLKAKAGRKK